MVSKATRTRRYLLLAVPLLVATVLLATGAKRRSHDPAHDQHPPITADTKVFSLRSADSFYPWQGTFRPSSLSSTPGATWSVDFDVTADMSRLVEFPDVVKGLYVVLVGEQVYDAGGKATGLTAISVSSRFTSAGIPLSYYEGTMPVRALGNRRGSPLEVIKEFPAGAWARGGVAHLKGRLTARLPRTLPHGYYRPHVDLFVKFAGSNTPISIGHLPYQLGQWLEDNLKLAGPTGLWSNLMDKVINTPVEFMHDPQVLPEVVVGRPARPRIPWTMFQDVADYGQSGLLSARDSKHLGLLNRVRYPTPFQLYPRRYRATPGIPTLFPEAALASLFIGEETVPPMIKNYLNFSAGRATATLTGPDGKPMEFGSRSFTGSGRSGPRLERGGFLMDLTRTGKYRLQLTGHMEDHFGRRYDAGGSYDFTVALPLSFSTPVKPGTNFIAGATFPAAAHVNPPVPAEVTIKVWYYPQSDVSRVKHVVFTGKANRFGHFSPHYTPDSPPLKMPEPGEYRSQFSARFVDARGRLWRGVQTSAGVIADKKPLLKLHGGRTYISPPRPDREHYGGWARYQLDFEGASSYLDDELLSQFDHIFPYHSGDTLFVATTYPFESVVGIVQSMEATNEQLARRLVRAYNPKGRVYNYPLTPRWRKPVYLPDVFKFGEDNFGYHRISVKHPDHLPILSANARGLSPHLYPEDNQIEAYTYLSVIRPGFPVMSLAYSGSFMGPCWIVSPNPYGGQINASPNGDLPWDLYRIMSGLVVKDLESGKNYYDAYAAAIVALPPGSHANAVSAPGQRPIMQINGRKFFYFMGMDTSDVFIVGERMMLGGSVMPSVPARVTIVVTRPDGTRERMSGKANRLGGFGPPRPIQVDQPGVYRVKVQVEHLGKTADVMGTGDGEFYHFAIPADGPDLITVGLPAASAVRHGGEVKIPLSWPASLEKARVTYSVMMPGTVIDEGVKVVRGNSLVFPLDPAQASNQFPFIDKVDHSSGEKIYADTLIATFLLEAERDGVKVHDAVRVILRGNMLFNARALTGKGATAPGGGAYPAGHPAGVPRCAGAACRNQRPPK